MITYPGRLVTVAATALVLTLSVSATAMAQTVEVKSKLKLSFAGVNVGKLKSWITVGNGRYAIKGGMKTNTLVSIVAKTEAGFSSGGLVVEGRLVPNKHQLTYKQRKKKGLVKLAFADGNISERVARPNVRYKPDATKVTAEHLKSVLDPASALVFPVARGKAGNGKAICNRTVPVFDGKNRINLRFSYKSTTDVAVDGYKGPVYTCAVRYQPVAGMRLTSKRIRFMRENRQIQVTLAPVGNSNVYALFGFKVKTRRGTASGRAYTFAVTNR